MWNQRVSRLTFLRMAVQAVLAITLVYDFSYMVLLAMILLGLSMVLDPRDQPLPDTDQLAAASPQGTEPPGPPAT